MTFDGTHIHLGDSTDNNVQDDPATVLLMVEADYCSYLYG